MYSGQEIVSQEECKIVLAEFYEGINCYNPNDKTIQMTLKDWATATYVDKTLTTIAFSVRPVNITLPLSKFITVSLDNDTTGLEVIMHTEEYEKIRIMPLIYLPVCSSYNFDNDNDSVRDACITPTITKFTIIGELDKVTATAITLISGTEISLLDINDNVISHNATFTYTTIDIEVYNPDKIMVPTKVILVEATKAVSIKINDYSYTLYSCQYGPITDFTYCKLPTEVRITAITSDYKNIGDGWFEIGTTQFKLLPTMNFLRRVDTIFFFDYASDIEFRIPIEATYTIYPCDDCPIESFDLDSIEYFDEDYKLHLQWDIKGYYTIDGNCVIDMTTNDRYCFYTDKLSLPAEQGLIANDCHTFYRKNGGARIETPSRGLPTPPDQRLVWSQAKCKFILRCENIGSYPCYTCIDCENQSDGESVRLFSKDMPTNKVCTSLGQKDIRDYVFGSQAGVIQSLGVYPNIPINVEYPVAMPTTANFIYIKGTRMFLKVTNEVDFTYFTFIGDLASGIISRDIKDDSSKVESIKTVLFLPFLYLTVFKLPFKYVKNSGLDQAIWSDMDPDLPEISPAQGYDFRIKTSSLTGLVDPVWSTGFDWSYGCAWTSASIFNSAPSTNIVITPSTISAIDDIDCELKKRVTFQYSNIPLLNGIGAPAGTYGVYQVAYDKYVEDIRYLVSKDAEAYAYQTLAYKQESKPRYPHV